MIEVYGIDLGTTNSCIAVIDDNGLPLVMKNLDDEFTTPSVVYFDEVGDPLVGREGKNSMGKDYRQAVAFIKREMSNVDYKREINGKSINPVKISSMILKKMIDDANILREEDGKAPIYKAVITVPAYFGSSERENTRQAAELAGIEVIALINEPTAAALCYGAKKLENKTFMIYDLGGGTFDVSIMRMKDGVMETLASEGNHKLGGVDWDAMIVDHGLEMEGYEETYDDIKNESDTGKMMLAAEVAKKKLSEAEEVSYRFLFRKKTHMLKIKRSVFEELTSELVQRTIDLVHHTMDMAKLKEPDLKIEEIILVGGSSYMPIIKKKILKEFPNINIRLDRFEPDLAVAKGAAIYASQQTGTKTNIVIGTDLGTRSYGIECYSSDENDMMIVANILYKTDPLIISETKTFRTNDEGQTEARLAVYENESIDEEVALNKCLKLQEDFLRWAKPVPKNTAVEVTFERNNDGILKVHGTCQGQIVQFEIKPKQSLSKTEAEEWRKELDMHTF